LHRSLPVDVYRRAGQPAYAIASVLAAADFSRCCVWHGHSECAGEFRRCAVAVYPDAGGHRLCRILAGGEARSNAASCVAGRYPDPGGWIFYALLGHDGYLRAVRIGGVAVSGVYGIGPGTRSCCYALLQMVGLNRGAGRIRSSDTGRWGAAAIRGVGGDSVAVLCSDFAE